jgi:hypothetical protein
MVSNIRINTKVQSLGFGETQQPGWEQYADNVDTVKFLMSL